MANTPQAKKRVRQAEVRRKHNASQRSAMRTTIKKTIAAVDSEDYEVASAVYAAAVPVLDRMVTHGVIHRNKVARHKSRLNARIKALKA